MDEHRGGNTLAYVKIMVNFMLFKQTVVINGIAKYKNIIAAGLNLYKPNEKKIATMWKWTRTQAFTSGLSSTDLRYWSLGSL